MVGQARSITVFSKQDIVNLFKTARTKTKYNGLEIRLAPEKINELGRILIITPRRSGNAVQRNRIKRRLKNIFYQEHLFEYNRDCIVLVGRQAIDLSFDELKNVLSKAFQNS